MIQFWIKKQKSQQKNSTKKLNEKTKFKYNYTSTPSITPVQLQSSNKSTSVHESTKKTMWKNLKYESTKQKKESPIIPLTHKSSHFSFIFCFDLICVCFNWIDFLQLNLFCFVLFCGKIQRQYVLTCWDLHFIELKPPTHPHPSSTPILNWMK